MYGASIDNNSCRESSAAMKRRDTVSERCLKVALKTVGSICYINKRTAAVTESLLRTADSMLRAKVSEITAKRAQADSESKTADICATAVALSVSVAVFFTLFAASAPSRAFSGGVGGELIFAVIVYAGVHKLISWLQGE